MFLYIICAAILIILGFIGTLSIASSLNSPLAGIIYGAIITLIALIFLISYDNLRNPQETPKAIDVYRGNTTLQITYQDSIPVDSMVVYKTKKEI